MTGWKGICNGKIVEICTETETTYRAERWAVAPEKRNHARVQPPQQQFCCPHLLKRVCATRSDPSPPHPHAPTQTHSPVPRAHIVGGPEAQQQGHGLVGGHHQPGGLLHHPQRARLQLLPGGKALEIHHLQGGRAAKGIRFCAKQRQCTPLSFKAQQASPPTQSGGGGWCKATSPSCETSWPKGLQGPSTRHPLVVAGARVVVVNVAHPVGAGVRQEVSDAHALPAQYRLQRRVGANQGKLTHSNKKQLLYLGYTDWPPIMCSTACRA